MNKLFSSITICGGVLLAGCSTPSEVKNLAQETRVATARMAEIHQQDLRTLAAYDRARVAQFNQLLNNYFTLREQVVNAFNEALDTSKRAGLAELDHAFDQRAGEIMTVQFWAGFREESDKDLNNFLVAAKEKATDVKAQAIAYSQDPNSRNQSVIAARQLYLATALDYQTVESSFAELVRRIHQARSEFHSANEKLFAEIKPLSFPELPNEVKNFALSNNTAEINQRVSDLKDAYAKIDDAQKVMVRYLDENNPGADFFVSVGQAVVGISSANNSASTNPVPNSPLDSNYTELPGLNALFNQLTSRVKQVEVQKSAGAGGLDQVISQLINNSKPLVHVVTSSVPGIETLSTAK